MQLDHIIIFSNSQGQEVEELLQFGLYEGSNRIHPGQGTRNRKLYFQNVFLEIVWVHDELEAKSDRTSPTGLWERSKHLENAYSPFGLCFSNSRDLDPLFVQSHNYSPTYLPDGKNFEILKNELYPSLPWCCRLPRMDKQNQTSEPLNHPIGIRYLTGVELGIQASALSSQFKNLLEKLSVIRFKVKSDPLLILEFDKGINGLEQQFKTLPLIIRY